MGSIEIGGADQKRAAFVAGGSNALEKCRVDMFFDQPPQWLAVHVGVSGQQGENPAFTVDLFFREAVEHCLEGRIVFRCIEERVAGDQPPNADSGDHIEFRSPTAFSPAHQHAGSEGAVLTATRNLQNLDRTAVAFFHHFQATAEFQITYYYLWHHEGRRARQGAMMGGPGWAHWHGFFELQQDLYKLEQIHAKRIASGEIE